MITHFKNSDLEMSREEFDRRVSTYVERMNEYLNHLRGVEQDRVNPDLKPEDQRFAFPPPDEAWQVKAAVWVDETPDDDGCVRNATAIAALLEKGTIPPAVAARYEIHGPSLAERKIALTADLKQNEGILLAKVAPPAKIRHWQFREQDIRAADQMRVDNHPTKIDPKQVDSWLRSVRPAEETTFLDDLKARRDTSFAIQRWAAKNEHDIDDLTEETVDAWKLEPFNG